MSALPSATAAKTDRESADHDTVRAMNVGRPVKSVIWRQSPFDVDSAQMFVLNPSVPFARLLQERTALLGRTLQRPMVEVRDPIAAFGSHNPRASPVEQRSPIQDGAER